MADLKTLENKVRELETRLKAIEAKVLAKDPLYNDARRLVVKHQKASVIFLQRYLIVGFERAARILAQLEEDGVVGPAAGGEPRKILADK